MICSVCGKNFEISRQGIRYRTKHNVPLDICPDCQKVNSIQRSKTTRATMTDEQRRSWYEKISKARKKEYANMSEDEKKKRFGYLREEAIKYRNSMTKEQKDAERTRSSMVFSNYWASLSQEERDAKSRDLSERWNSFSDEKKRNIRNKQSAAMKRNWSEKTEEERREAAERSKQYWESLTETRRNEIKQHLTHIREEYWSSISDDERKLMNKKLSESAKKYQENMPPEKRLELNQLLSDKAKRRWANLPKEIRETWIDNARIGLQKYWDSISAEKRIEHFRKTADGMANNYIFNPTPSEVQFINELNMLEIPYKYQWNNKSISDEFYNYYSIDDNPYHVWDFNVHTRDGDILVDIDGSIHLIPVGKCKAFDNLDLGELIQYRDTKRKYQTDNLRAYVVRAYQDKINKSVIVSNLQTGECMEFHQFISLLKFWNSTGEEQQLVIGNLV